MGKITWHLRKGTPEYIKYMKEQRGITVAPESLRVDRPVEIERIIIHEPLPPGKGIRAINHQEKGPVLKTEGGAKVERVVHPLGCAADVPNWLVLLHLFPKKLNPNIYGSIQKVLDDFEYGYAIPTRIRFEEDNKQKTLHVSGESSIAVRVIDYWTEHFGDVEVLAEGRQYSEMFQELMYETKPKLRKEYNIGMH